MTRSEGGDRRTTDTRERLVSAAVDRVDEVGWDRLSLSAVARACGISPPACYKHFPDREHLLAAALLALSAQVGRRARARLRPDPQDSLLGVARLLVTMAQEHPRLLDLLLFSPAALAALDGTGRYPLLDLVRGEVARMAARHDLDATTLFTVLWAFIQGYSRLVATGAATYDTDLLRQTMKAFTTIGKRP